MADIFISYSSQDKTIVKQLAGLLEKKGWTVWWDREIPIGQQYDTVIENELQQASCVIVIWTKRSVGSEWVKNEAAEASQKNKLLPIMLEEVSLPLAFKRTEYAMLIGWNGQEDHPELEMLYRSVENIIRHKNDAPPLNNNSTTSYDHKFLKKKRKLIIYGSIAIAGIAALLTYYYLRGDQRSHVEQNPERTVTIRVFDWKKNAVTQGDVKIYLKEYIRNQSIDKMGQALFTGIPANNPDNKIKIEISSPGYFTKVFDTTLIYSKPMEIILPLTSTVVISGKIKTAAEMPIQGVEIDVDGTKYFSRSITDGSYSLRLEEYTLGDEITLTTSHKDFEDKTVSLKINAAEIRNQDIFLNPVKH